MAQQGHEKVKEIFIAALKHRPAERLEFLDRKCRNDAVLREEVGSLLSSFENDPGFLETPVLGEVADSLITQSCQLASGQKFGPYEIIEQIGVGGMGEVYLARDSRLKRNVALKLMPARLFPDKNRLERFEKEAFAVSSLNHPNILTIYEIGEKEDSHFISTEYVDGKTLKEYCAGEEPGMASILDIAIQVSSALSVAHRKGIIHRDIKPENIMVREDGYIKILDFGVAKLTDKHGSIDIDGGESVRTGNFTDTGVVMGTASYMSPEQARGKKTDERTDIWSLGVVLYEMLSGEKPFTGETPTEIIAEIIHEEPTPISSYVENLPVELEAIVTRALCKDLDGRYQTAGEAQTDLEKVKQQIEFEYELERSAAPDRKIEGKTGEYPPLLRRRTPTLEPEAATTGEQTARSTLSGEYLFHQFKTHKLGTFLIFSVLLAGSLAAGYYFIFNNETPVLTDKDVVLLIDFENKTGEEIFDETLRPGLAMQLQQSRFLSLLPENRVRRTLQLMKRPPDERVTRELGKEICHREGLKALIAGTIIRLDRNYSLTLEAVDSRTGESIAITQAEAKGKDQVLSSLSKIATQLRKKLGESLASIMKFDKPLPMVTTDSLEALRFFQLGYEKQTKGKYLEAIPFFKRAIEIDPDFASAHRRLSVVYWNRRQFKLSREEATKAYELRDRTTEYERIKISEMYFGAATYEADKSIEVFKLAKQTFPGNASFRHDLAAEYMTIGQYENALAEAREAMQIRPNGFNYDLVALVLFASDRFAEAKEAIERAIQLNYRGPNYHDLLYKIAFFDNDTDQMQKQIDLMRSKRNETFAEYLQAKTAASRGRWKLSQEFFRKSIGHAELSSNKGLGSRFNSELALTAAVLGKCSKARSSAVESLRLEKNLATTRRAALALVFCGEISRANRLIEELTEEYSKATVLNRLWLPTIKAEIAMQSGDHEKAVRLLERALNYERAGRYYPQYIRGQAYLKLKENEKAKTEFQKILDHRGQGALSILYPLAQLGKARATRDKGEYGKFFKMWKDADPNLSLLTEADEEFKEL